MQVLEIMKRNFIFSIKCGKILKPLNLVMETLYLTNSLRQELKKPLGRLILENEKQITENLKKIIKKEKVKKIITVGDYCSLTLPSEVKIFDGRIKRNKRVSLLKYSLSVLNPPASVHKKVWKVLKKAIEEKRNLFVRGEEDLLVLPSVILAENGDIVVYGVFGKGICIIKVSDKSKQKVQEILNRFKKEKFKKIVLGGTFNYLHKGHQYFLRMARYYAKEAIVGLCSDQMVKKRKRNWKMVLPFKQRKRVLKSYLDKINLCYKIVKIDDIYGPSITDKSLEAILLTEDTLENGKRINRIRKKRGLPELNYIVLPYVLDSKGRKISSSRMRLKNMNGATPTCTTNVMS